MSTFLMRHDALCFMLPAFLQLLALTLLYSAYGALDVIQNALYGIAAVVLAIFAAALYRLGRSALTGPTEIAIAAVAALGVAFTPAGIVSMLLFAACAAVARYHSCRQGLTAAATLVLLFALSYGWRSLPDAHLAVAAANATSPTLAEIAASFLKVGAFTFGGALSMVALVQEHVVVHARWLTAREFLDGLALGQLTPGPTLMIAAYVGYKTLGLVGAITAAVAIFLPAFALMLALMPVLDRFGRLGWVKPAMRGISAAVIGCLAVTLAQLLPHAAPDVIGLGILIAGTAATLLWRIAPVTLIIAGAVAGLGVKLIA